MTGDYEPGSISRNSSHFGDFLKSDEYRVGTEELYAEEIDKRVTELQREGYADHQIKKAILSVVWEGQADVDREAETWANGSDYSLVQQWVFKEHGNPQETRALVEKIGRRLDQILNSAKNR